MANDGRIFLQSIEFAPSSSPDEEDLLEEDAKNDLALAFLKMGPKQPITT